MSEMSPERLAEVREDDSRLVQDLGPRPTPPPLELAHVEHPQTTLVRLAVDRRDLLAHIDHLTAEGRCGNRFDGLGIAGPVSFLCCLRAGHKGWHEDAQGCEWMRGSGTETP